MDLLIISGFLGSGKTTMILSAAEVISRREGKSVVVIVNDFGQVGIDAKVMEKFGLKTKELPSGCICCTLGSDLLSTLKDVAENLRPDLIFIEPSGIADPSAIRDLLRFHDGPKLNSVRCVSIVDALRYETILKALPKLLMSQIRAADVIVINKVEDVDEGRLKGIEESVRSLGGAAPRIRASAVNGVSLDKVVDAMLQGCPVERQVSPE